MSGIPETEPSATLQSGRAPGDILRQAREGKNLSVAAIATQLNLDLRTIEALERGEQDKLPAPIFVRGYLRGYARLVGVSEEEVLGAYRLQSPQQEPSPRAVGMRSAPLRPAYRGPLIPWRGLSLTAVLIVAVVVAFVYGPNLVAPFLTNGVSEDAAAPQLALPMPGDGDVVPADEPAAPAVVSDGLELPLPEPQPVPAEEPPPPMNAEPEPELPEEGDFAPRSEPAISTTAAPVASDAADELQLEFRFREDSWVEVRGADRARLLFGLMREGDMRRVSGKPPVSVLIGNAAVVDLQVNGSRFDLTAHTRNNIARFEVRAVN